MVGLSRLYNRPSHDFFVGLATRVFRTACTPVAATKTRGIRVRFWVHVRHCSMNTVLRCKVSNSFGANCGLVLGANQ